MKAFQQLVSASYNSDEQQNEDSHWFLLEVFKLLNTSLLLFGFSECILWQSETKSVWIAPSQPQMAALCRGPRCNTDQLCWETGGCCQGCWRLTRTRLIEAALRLEKLVQLSLLFVKWYLGTSKGKNKQDFSLPFKTNQFVEKDLCSP